MAFATWVTLATGTFRTTPIPGPGDDPVMFAGAPP